MIAGHDEAGGFDPVYQFAGTHELPVAGALGQIARDRHEVGRQVVDPRDQGIEKFRPDAAEVKVGQMQ